MGTVRYVCARWCVRSLVWAAGNMSVWFLLTSPSAASPAPGQKRPATVADSIRMVQIAGHLANLNYAGALTDNFACLSPDREQFVVILKKGNLERNTNATHSR